MRTVGTVARGIRLPIIKKGDDLASITADSILEACAGEGFELRDRDVVGITEAIAAKAQVNYATLDDIASDIAQKYPEGELGLVFPILSRNRFLNILKGIARGVKKLYIMLSYPNDEVGNPSVDSKIFYEKMDKLPAGLVSEKVFIDLFGGFKHPFTGMDYNELYKSAGEHIEIYYGSRVTDILKLTPYVLDAEIHMREQSRRRLEAAGAQRVYCLSDILSSPVSGSGYNEKYGVLGSNMSTENSLKLFPRDCEDLVLNVQKILKEKTGKTVEVMVYGDGAFKDPAYGIWELADPVVSPAYTKGLEGMPNEKKFKFLADTALEGIPEEEKRGEIERLIKTPSPESDNFSEGTTPRRYPDLLGSLCDLVSGSGDKGTPVVLIQGYFDNYASV